MNHHSALETLRGSLQDLRQDRMTIAGFCKIWRAQEGLLAMLPARYKAVMEDLLGRMEAGSLFTEENCSFSHADLQDGLAAWLDQASRQLAGGEHAKA